MSLSEEKKCRYGLPLSYCSGVHWWKGKYSIKKRLRDFSCLKKPSLMFIPTNNIRAITYQPTNQPTLPTLQQISLCCKMSNHCLTVKQQSSHRLFCHPCFPENRWTSVTGLIPYHGINTKYKSVKICCNHCCYALPRKMYHHVVFQYRVRLQLKDHG